MNALSTEDLISPCNANCSFCFLNYTDVLGNNSLFKNLGKNDIGAIIKSVHHQVKEYRKGDMIAHSGDQYTNLYIIVKGAVIGEIVDFEGKVIRIEELKAPDTIASAFIFGNNNALPVDITASRSTRLLVIPRNELIKIFRKYEVLLHNFLNIMSNRAQHLSKKIKMLGLQTIRGKLAHYLLEQSGQNNSDSFTINHTHASLAEIFGVSRPSLSRVIREFNSEGILSSGGKKYQITDPKRLSSYLK